MPRICKRIDRVFAAAAIGLAAASQGQLLSVEPISGELGLADVRVSGVPDDLRQVLVRFRYHPDGAWYEAPLLRVGEDETGSTFEGRFFAGEGQPHQVGRLRLRAVVVRDDGGVGLRTLDEFATEVDVVPEDADEAANFVPARSVPAWALGATWYQIFPERFYNGEPANDPAELTTFPLEWNADWDEVTPLEWEYSTALSHALGYRLDPDRPGGAKYNVIWNRRYGGDLQGVVEKLPFLQELGVTAIYMCPVFSAGSMHKYDARDYRHIDRTLGTPGEVSDEYIPDTESGAALPSWTRTGADDYFIEEFLPAVKDAGMRVVIDGVFNHVGREHFAFQDVIENGADSPYADWFVCRFDGDGRLIGWDAWDGPNGHLPEFRQTDAGDLVEPVKQHIFDVTRRWMDPNGDGDPSDGIDGWRLDVANEIGIAFWYDWRRLCRRINPECALFAEEWADGSRYFRGAAFDAQMNYPFARAVLGFLRDGVSSSETAERLAAIFNNDPYNDLAQMNLMSSHDTERLVSMLDNPLDSAGNPREYDQQAAMHQDAVESYNTGRPSERAYALALLAFAIQATHEGSPMIYDGDEAGMHGPAGPDNRKPIPWPELGAPGNPADLPRTDVLQAARTWFASRQVEGLGRALRYGSTRYIDTGNPDVLAYARYLNGDQVIVMVNRGSETFDASPFLPPSAPDASDRDLGPLEAEIWIAPRPQDFVWRPEIERTDPVD